MSQNLVAIARSVLRLEPLILTGAALAFAYAPPVRTDWLWLLLLWPVMLAARWLVTGRPLTRTPLLWAFVTFIALAALNVFIAPYTRGLEMLARPLLGMWLCWALIETARASGRMDGPLWALALLALLAGVLALGATQWSTSKSNQLWPIITLLPTIRGFPAFEGGMNPNEIAGALAWLVPLMAGIAAGPARSRGLRLICGVAFALLLLALFLGQSRAALFGTLAALGLIALLVVPAGRRRALALAGVALLLALELAIMSSLFTPAQRTQAAERNEISVGSRFDLLENSLLIIRDYPLTGVGLSMYRDSRVRQLYPTPAVNNRPPHTHNELLQAGTDMGVPGMIVFAGLHVAAAYMLFVTWNRGDQAARAVAVAVAAGLLAHMVYGLADAITVWDRLAFIFWLLLGLAGAQYVLTVTAADRLPARAPDTASPARTPTDRHIRGRRRGLPLRLS